MINDIIVHDDRGAHFKRGIQSAADDMRNITKMFKNFINNNRFRVIDGWCDGYAESGYEMMYFGSEEFIHNGIPLNIADKIFIRRGICDKKYDEKPFFVYEHEVVKFIKHNKIETKYVSKEKVFYNTKNMKYEPYISLFEKICNLFK